MRALQTEQHQQAQQQKYAGQYKVRKVGKVSKECKTTRVIRCRRKGSASLLPGLRCNALAWATIVLLPHPTMALPYVIIMCLLHLTKTLARMHFMLSMMMFAHV